MKRVNSSAVGPYAFKDKRWVSYDDPDMVRTKVNLFLPICRLGFNSIHKSKWVVESIIYIYEAISGLLY